jgi:hypothetical protein
MDPNGVLFAHQITFAKVCSVFLEGDQPAHIPVRRRFHHFPGGTTVMSNLGDPPSSFLNRLFFEAMAKISSPSKVQASDYNRPTPLWGLSQFKKRVLSILTFIP